MEENNISKEKLGKIEIICSIIVLCGFLVFSTIILVTGFKHRNRYELIKNTFVETVGRYDSTKKAINGDYLHLFTYEVDGAEYVCSYRSSYSNPPVNSSQPYVYVYYNPNKVSDSVIDLDCNDDSFVLLMVGSLFLFTAIATGIAIVYIAKTQKAKQENEKIDIEILKDINTIKCPYCGHTNPVAKEKCEFCGAKLRGK